jgi:hypothetical protein
MGERCAYTTMQSHTMLGSKTQRGMTQMALDVLFKSLSTNMRSPDNFSDLGLVASLAVSDPSEGQIFSAKTFLESVFCDHNSERGRGSRAQTPLVSSRAQTPMPVCKPSTPVLHLRFPRASINVESPVQPGRFSAREHLRR